jgi:hypothetical protein
MKTKATLVVMMALVVAVVSCKKKTEDPVYYTTSFKAGTTQCNFKTTSTFGKFCIVTHFCNSFYADPAVTSMNTLSIGLPSTVATGSVLHNGDGIQLVYIDKNGHSYFSSAYDSLTITVSEWGGHDGWARGSFSGKLRYTSSEPPVYDSIYITNGTFESKIWFYTK